MGSLATPAERKKTGGAGRGRRQRVGSALLLGLLLAAPGAAPALDLGVSLSDELLELSAAGGGTTGSSLRVGASFLQNDDSDSMFAFSAEVGNRYRVDAPGSLRYSAGARLLGLSLHAPADDFGAVAVGGSVGVALQAATPIALMFEAYHAPSGLIGGDASDLTHLALQLESRLVPGATAYTALRRIDVRSDAYADVRVDNSLLIGVTIHFD